MAYQRFYGLRHGWALDAPVHAMDRRGSVQHALCGKNLAQHNASARFMENVGPLSEVACQGCLDGLKLREGNA